MIKEQFLKNQQHTPNLFAKARLKRNLIAYAFLIIPLLLLTVFTFFPLIQGIYISFMDYNILNNSTIGGPIAFIKSFIGNLHDAPMISPILLLLSSIVLIFLILKTISRRVILVSFIALLVINLFPLGKVVNKTFQDINYSYDEYRTIRNDMVQDYVQMLKEQYGKDAVIIKEKVNKDETRVYVKRTSWVGTKFYRAIITNQPYVKFIKKNIWYSFLFAGLLLGLLVMRWLKEQRRQNRSLDLSIKGLLLLDALVFSIISWVQIFNSESWSFYQALKNSLVYILVVPPIQILSILLAILVNQKIKGIAFFRTLYYVPVITGVVIIGYCWKFIYQPNGLLDATFAVLHLKPLSWLGDSRIALYSIMFVTLWRGLGYYMILYLAGVQDISDELLEAARIDGASTFQLITKIYIPLLRRTILVCTVLSTIAALRVFEEIFVLSGGSTGAAPMNGTNTLVYMIYEKAFGQFGLQFSYSSAIAVILSIFIMIFTMINFKLERGSDQ
ncbi:MAG: carbohydrate ABC transporter permease [Bacillota bacterium]